MGSPETIERYFRAYRALLGRENIDKTNTVKHLSEGITGCKLPFKTVAEQFHLIDQDMRTVYIPSETNLQLLEKIKKGTANRDTYRKAGVYSVSIYENHYKEMLDAGDIEEIISGMAILRNMDQYDRSTGLSLAADSGRAEFV